MRLVTLILTATLALALPAAAQDRDETLADIRQEMSVLYVELQKLKRELSTTGAAGDLDTSGSVLDRVNSMEGELKRLTARTEEMQQRIDRVVSDGTNRLGDLEFRLIELEGGDTSQLGETTTLGGGDMPETGGGAITSSTILPAEEGDAASPSEPLAVGERADFDAAEAAFVDGDHADAAQKFETFLKTYPGSPLAPRANLMRGQALAETGDTKASAQAYLDAFSADKTGPEAPDALFRLGRALGQLGQTDAACQTLGQVDARFPGEAAAGEARDEMQDLGCQ